jgi:hypothetical protein
MDVGTRAKTILRFVKCISIQSALDRDRRIAVPHKIVAKTLRIARGGREAGDF